MWLDGFHEVLFILRHLVVDDEWEDDISLVHNQRIVQSRSELAAKGLSF